MANKRKRAKRDSAGSSTARKKKEEAASKKETHKKKEKRGSSNSNRRNTRNKDTTTTPHEYESNPNWNNPQQCLVYNVIQRLAVIAQSKQKCTGAIQAIPTASFQPPKSDAHPNHSIDAGSTAAANATGKVEDNVNVSQVDYNNLSHDANANVIIVATILLNHLLVRARTKAPMRHASDNSSEKDTTGTTPSTNTSASASTNTSSTSTKSRDQDANVNSTSSIKKGDKRSSKKERDKDPQDEDDHDEPTSSSNPFPSRTDRHVALVQGLLANLLSTILMNDKSLLERTMNSHTQNRTSISISASSSAAAANLISSTSASTSTSTPASNHPKPVVCNRDAKTLLAKSVLSVILSTIDSLKSITSIHEPHMEGDTTSTLDQAVAAMAAYIDAASDADTDEDMTTKRKKLQTNMDADDDGDMTTKRKKLQTNIWKNLSTVERILAIPKRKHSMTMSLYSTSSITSSISSSIAAPSTSVVTVGGSSSSSGGTSGSGEEASGVLHIPLNSQHAHSLAMNAKRMQEWNALCHVIDGSSTNGNGFGSGSTGTGVGAGTVTSGNASSAAGTTSTTGTRISDAGDLQLEDYVYECHTVSQILDTFPPNSDPKVDHEASAAESTRSARTTSAKRASAASAVEEDANSSTSFCGWMKPFVMHVSSSSRMEEDDVATLSPPTKRTRKSKNIASTAPSSSVNMASSENYEERLKEYLLGSDRVIDGRVAVRKFSSMAFVHCCAGHYHLLDCLRRVLSDDDAVRDRDPSGNSSAHKKGQEDDERLDHAFGSWAEIMNPGQIRWEKDSESTMASKKAKKKKVKSFTHINVSGSLALSVLSSRVIEIVQESGKLCGNFPSKNGMEKYIHDLYDVFHGVGGCVNDSAKSGSIHELKAKRPNIYNVGVMVLRTMLLNHEKCLIDIANSTSMEYFPFDTIVERVEQPHSSSAHKRDHSDQTTEVGHILINEEETAKDCIVRDYAMYHPLMHKTIESLIKSIHNTQTSTSKNESKILYAIAAAFAFKCSIITQKIELPASGRKGGKNPTPSIGSVVVVDAKLSSFAITQLTEIVDNIIKLTKQSFRGDDVDPAAKDMSSTIIMNFLLEQPLLPTSVSKQAGLFYSYVSGSSPNVELGEEKGWRNGFLLSLFLRVLLPDKVKAVKSVAMQTPSSLVKRLLSVVRTCYAVKPDSTDTEKLKKSPRFTRCSLAADCLDAVRKVISHIPYQVSVSGGKPIATIRFRSVLRKCIGADIVHSFVQLGLAVEHILVQQRFNLCDAVDNTRIQSTDAEPSTCHVDIGKLEYEQWERRLWSSHFKCCLSFVRGSATYISRISNASPTMKKSIFGSSTEKLALFKAVAGSEMSSEGRWPLYLSSSQHAIVSGILTCDPLPRTVKEASPERFICEGFIESISEALKNPETFVLNVYNVVKNPKILVSDEEVPLSLRDARLFAVALNRTPRKEQLVLTSKLVGVLHRSIARIEKDDDLRLLLQKEQSFSGFIARTLTVCSTIIDMVSSGKVLLDSLCEFIGPLHYHLPSFIEVEDHCDTSRQDCISDWYKRDSCFMSLWPDWEMASLPPVEIVAKIDPLTSDDIKDYKEVLDVALNLGFQTATNDMCHLVFSSWNASAKLCGVDNEVWTGPSTSNEMIARSNPSKLTNIRRDICQLFYELVDDDSATPNSFLTVQLKRKRRRQGMVGRQGRSIALLDSAVTESVKMLENLSSTADDRNIRTSFSGDCAVMEATLSYVTFIASMFTTSGTDLLVAVVKRDRNRRKRKNSSFSGESMNDHDMDDGCSEDSGSDGYHEFDEEEDEEDAQMDGITRLHNICNDLGASPFHPDWLDSNCRLRTGITETSGVEKAESMLLALTNFALKAFAKYKRCLNDAVSICVSDRNIPTTDGTAAVSALCGIRGTESKTDTSVSTPLWQNAIADIFNVEAPLIQAIIEGLQCRNSDAVKESFALNSAHQIKGKMQDFLSSGNGWLPDASEYRSAGEFELLLSDALIGSCSCLDISRPPQKEYETLSDTNENQALKSRFSDLLRWKRILRSSVDAMVVVNALLRFCLNGGKGRQLHRALTDEFSTRILSSPSFQASPIREHIRDRNLISMDNLSILQLKKTVNKSVCFLAEVQASGILSRTIKQSARSASCHLVTSETDLIAIEDVHAVRNSLVGMKELSKGSNLNDGSSQKEAFSMLVESMSGSDHISEGFESKILFCLGSATELKISTIVESSVDLKRMLRKSGVNWEMQSSSTEEIRFLSEVVQGRHDNIASAAVRLRIIGFLIDAMDAEANISARLGLNPDETLRKVLLRHWCDLDAYLHETIVKRDLCFVRDIEHVNVERSKPINIEIMCRLCSFIARLFQANSTTSTTGDKMFRTMFRTLKDNMRHWVGEKDLGHVMCFTCILAMQYGNLNDIGQDLLKLLKANEADQAERYLCGLEIFYRFIEDIRKALDGKFETGKLVEQSEHLSKKSVLGSSIEPLQNQCSFVSTHGEFTEQHWYNCYTCGLTWDKGCCSLCARVCHKGHDVGYSRKSSFFCDCGAEVKTETGRISCKCLSPLPPGALSAASETCCEMNKVSSEVNPDQSCDVEGWKGDFWEEVITTAAAYCTEAARNSLDRFVNSIDAALIEDLFETFNEQFDLWVNEESMRSFLSNTKDKSIEESPEESLKERSILSRDGLHLEIDRLPTPSFHPLRMSRTGAINAKISADLSISKTKKALLTKNILTRNITTADSRGRLIIAEPKALLFCGALPLVNIRHNPHNLDNGLLRSQLCVLGSHKLDFGVVGVSVCPGRDRHLAVWGIASARFMILSETCDKVDLSVELITGIEAGDCDSNYIVKVEWVSGNVVAVFCALSVKLYDIASNSTEISGTVSCRASLNYVMEFDDVLIRSGVVIPREDDGMDDEIETDEVNSLRRIVILFDTGRLYMVDFTLNRDSGLDNGGDISVEYGEGITFPIAGVRRFSGTSPEPAGSTSKSLGEGSCLVYMRQSNILLYKCISSAMVAFLLNGYGEIVGSFEFLPHIIKSEVLDQSGGDSLSGPYTNWTELGTIPGDPDFFRAAFVAKSSSTNQPHLVFIEYNSECSKVRRLKMPGNVNLTMNMNSSYEGLSAFSGPLVVSSGSSNGMLTKDNFCVERAYLVSLTSNGILTFHGEGEDVGWGRCRNRASSFTESVKFKDANKLPNFPLTIFESLENITSLEEVTFSGNGVDESSSDTKKKLSTGSNEYVVSPPKDGCSFIISLEKKTAPKKVSKTTKSNSQDSKNHVIVAIRLLLGTNSTTEFTPRDVSIMGRTVKSTTEKKRWYDVPLTDEEILIGVRTGFVSLCIGGALEGDRNQVLIDSIEVYAKDKAELSHLFPFVRHEFKSSESTHHSSLDNTIGNNRKPLSSSIVIISHALQLLGGASGVLSSVSEESLQRLIQVTALDPNEEGSVRKHVIELLKELEPDPQTMQMLVDKGTLQGICNILKDLDAVMVDIFVDTSIETANQNRTKKTATSNIGEKVLKKVNHCLSAAIAIAKERPMNYKHAIETLIGTNSATSSIAPHAAKFVEKCQECESIVETSSKLVELTIHEILSNPGNQTTRSAQSFANIEMLTIILRLSNHSVIETCCETIARVLKDLPAEVMLHKCDCCGVLPIVRKRYTMDEEACDIDLCQDCYNRGIAHAAIKEYSSHIPVLVGNKNIHIKGNKDLSCADIRKMTPKIVPEEPIDAPTSATLRALIFDNLLAGVINDMPTSLNLSRSNTIPVMDVLLSLVLQCNKVEEKIELGEAMCRMLCKEIAELIEQNVEGTPIAANKRNRYFIVLFLRTLTALITKQDKISLTTQARSINDDHATKSTFQPSPAPASKSKTDPRFVCGTHGVPAVRRRCSHGEHKDRRFYVCGMDRKNRCKYFAWADEVDDSKVSPGRTSARPKVSLPQLDMSDSSEEVAIDSKLQSILWRQLNGGNPPLHKKLCTLLRNFIKKSESLGAVHEQNSNLSSSKVCKHLLSTARDNDQIENGAFLSVEKIGFSNMPGRGSLQTPSQSVNSNMNEYLGIEASLDFLSLVASQPSDITHKSSASWEVWYSPLCYIISKESPPRLKSKAKKMLKCITGGRRAAYHQVRDRFVFASQFADLLAYCAAPLEAALFVRQKARQCGPQWRLSNATWETLGTGGLLGTQPLISEDNYTVTEMEKVTKVLDSLITITRSRSDNWRHFCALDSLPQKDTDLEFKTSVELPESGFLHHQRSPICLLFWMACSLPGEHQVQLLQLIDTAIQRGTGAISYDETHGIMSTDVGTDADAEVSTGDNDTPEKVLLSGASGLSTNDLCAFATTFVLHGESKEIRLRAKNIIQNLIIRSCADSLKGFFEHMAALCMTEVGPCGQESIEFLQFLTNVMAHKNFIEGMNTNIIYLSKVAVSCFLKQTNANKNFVYCPSNKNIFELKTKKDKGVTERFDLTKCSYYQDYDIENATSDEKMIKTTCLFNEYRRIRLDQHHAVSTEFSSYVQLKNRLSISEIFLSVTDQRGRFVKTIHIFFTPRHVNDINDLKDESYDPFWQKCGTLSLSRGANKASIKLPSGVVASNLKFEYVDFYEKITGARTSSGAMVLHCPRCTRVVNNAHGGVCGHCGEVAFQCRKCRHINYDRLDAFLCVECGYCSSGMFSFELDACEALSALSIQDESDLENSVVALHAKNKEYTEVKNLFKKYASSEKHLAGVKRKQHTDGNITDKLESFNGPLKRALLGDLPRISISKSNSDKKKDTKRSELSSNRPSASSRARSLLSLARQLRGESEGDVRSSLGDILVQQARLNSGSRSNFPFDDTDDDMIMNSGDGNMIPFDMQDPLSRLVANIQARARGDTDSSPQRANDRRNKKESSEKGAEDAIKYYRQLKGIERNCSEISKRIIAWKRMNQDALADYGYVMTSLNYTPTFCSYCAHSVALHLLQLVHALLSCDIESVIESSVPNTDFVSSLFDDHTTDSSGLAELKRSVLVTIAKKSNSGSELIMAELRERMNGGKDPMCAEILGSLLQNNVRNHDSFVDLAVTMLGR